jgi:hypothetical protein
VLAGLKKWLANAFRSSYEKRLLLIARGDEGQVDRLIAMETSRNPSLSRKAAARAAVERYENDRR